MMGWMDGRKHRLLWLGGWQWMDKAAKSLNLGFSFLLQSNNRAAQICGVFTVPGIFQYEHRRGPLSPAELRQRCGDYGRSNQPYRTWTSGQQTYVYIKTSKRHHPAVNQRKKEDFKRQRINNWVTDKKFMFPTFTTIFTSTWLSVWS